MTPRRRETWDTGSATVTHTLSRSHVPRAPAPIRRAALAACCTLALTMTGVATARAQKAPPALASALAADAAIKRLTFTDAQGLFYNARYAEAADLALALRDSETHDLANDELRTSALLFQLKALLEIPGSKEGNKKNALTGCTTCPALMEAFFADVRHGQALARETLRTSPGDEVALFYLGKLDLNYVWLQLGPLRKKTGWDEYWEARHSLDAVLKANPQHVRAIVSRAWIDYIVDTRMPWGTRWILGGGSRQRALTAIGGATAIESPFYAHAEAEFALWDLQVRERDMAGATEVARRLARAFPENREVANFLEARHATPPD
jgi:hypothetical protein